MQSMQPGSQLLVAACTWLSVGGCVVLKLPQLAAVWRSGSVAGVSCASLALETLHYCITLAYTSSHGHPLHSYLEYIVLVPQDVLLLLLVLHTAGSLHAGSVAALTAGLAAEAVALSGNVPQSLIDFLFQLSVPLGWSSKVVQLRAIVVEADARGVSAVTWTLAAATSAARIITTLAESGDRLLLASYSVSLALNVAVLAAAYRYRHGPAGSRSEDKHKQQ